MPIEAFFDAVAEAVFGYMLQEADLGGRLRTVLGVDPQRKAFKTALARAYTAFARQYPDLIASLFDKSFLTSEAAMPVLAQLLTRRGQPDPAELARRWARTWATAIPILGRTWPGRPAPPTWTLWQAM